MWYERGGVSGTFAGSCHFRQIQHSTLDAWAYHEVGAAALNGIGTLEAQRRLIWDFTCPLVRVSFDESSLDRSDAAILKGARFFHSVSLEGGAVVLSEHPCGPDVYRGSMLFQGPDSFTMVWRVSGPRKLGEIHSSFRRQDPRAPGTDYGSAARRTVRSAQQHSIQHQDTTPPNPHQENEPD